MKNNSPGSQWLPRSCGAVGENVKRIRAIIAFSLASFILSGAVLGAEHTDSNARLIALGESIFFDKALSADGATSCDSCHSPSHAFADVHALAIGSGGTHGTRNAPSLVGVAGNSNFFWDGRRSRIADAVMDPFTNPAELALDSDFSLLERVRRDAKLVALLQNTFPSAPTPTIVQLRVALVAFVSSLTSGTSPYDVFRQEHRPLPMSAERGRRLFEGRAGCSDCHRTDGEPATFSDDQYHPSAIGQLELDAQLGQLTQAVLRENLSETELGPRILSNKDWSSLGRFVVTHRASDIGLFRTPSLRNVAVSSPYMHDGSVNTLEEAVDREIYYRNLSHDKAITLTSNERRAIVAFLHCLTDLPYGASPSSR